MRQVLCTTRSLCPTCLREIPASIVCEDRIYLEKECPNHGQFKVPHLWESEGTFRLRDEMQRREERAARGLLLNVTNRCNLSCSFCFTYANDLPQEEMGLDEMKRYLREFKGAIVYLSGGEPTVRADLPDLVREIRLAGFTPVLLSNGKRLADRAYVDTLKEAGLEFVILGFDSLKEAHYEELRGEPTLLRSKKAALENLKGVGIPTYLFVMVVRGRNDSEIGELVRFMACDENIRIINFQPVWDVGRVGAFDPGCNPVEILKMVEKATGISEKEFVDSTLFIQAASDVISTLKGGQYNTHPSCEAICYIFPGGNRVIPLSRILPLERLIPAVRWASKARERIDALLRLGAIAPLLCLLLAKAMLTSRLARKAVLSGCIAAFKRGGTEIGKGTIFKSIIVGHFPTTENIDLEMTRTCNLSAVIPRDLDKRDGEIVPACVRQILVNADFEGRTEIEKRRRSNDIVRQRRHNHRVSVKSSIKSLPQ